MSYIWSGLPLYDPVDGSGHIFQTGRAPSLGSPVWLVRSPASKRSYPAPSNGDPVCPPSVLVSVVDWSMRSVSPVGVPVRAVPVTSAISADRVSTVVRDHEPPTTSTGFRS